MPKRSGKPHVDDPKEVGRRLKEARQRAGMSQRQLAFPGCTAVYICRIEQGHRVPSLQVIRELARRLAVDEDWLAMGSARSRPSDLLLEAEVALRFGELEPAEHLYLRALEDAASRWERAQAVAGLGQIDFHAGRLDRAIERLEEARSLLGDAVSDEQAVPETLARAHSARGEHAAAIAVLESTLELARRRNDDFGEARFSVLLASALIDSGDLQAARVLLREALAKRSGEPGPALLARRYWSQSRLHLAGENGEAASRYAHLALAASELTDDVACAARAYGLLAFAELERGNAEEALALLDQGYPLALRAGDTAGQARFRIERARALAKLGRSEEAIPLATEVAAALADSSPLEAGRAYAIAAEASADTGDRVRALELYELAAELVSDHGRTSLVDLYSRMAELLEALGRKDEALGLLKRAVGLRGPSADRAYDSIA